jgi:hypothetical protein
MITTTPLPLAGKTALVTKCTFPASVLWSCYLGHTPVVFGCVE